MKSRYCLRCGRYNDICTDGAMIWGMLPDFAELEGSGTMPVDVAWESTHA